MWQKLQRRVQGHHGLYRRNCLEGSIAVVRRRGWCQRRLICEEQSCIGASEHSLYNIRYHYWTGLSSAGCEVGRSNIGNAVSTILIPVHDENAVRQHAAPCLYTLCRTVTDQDGYCNSQGRTYTATKQCGKGQGPNLQLSVFRSCTSYLPLLHAFLAVTHWSVRERAEGMFPGAPITHSIE
jgi:hypothetical protein